MRLAAKSYLVALSGLLLGAIRLGAQVPSTQSSEPCRAAFASVVARLSLDREIEDYRLCADSKPTAGFPHYDLGLLYEAQGNWALAQKELTTGLSLGISSDLTANAQREIKVLEHRQQEVTPTERALSDHLDRAARAKRYFDTGQLPQALALARSLTSDQSTTYLDYILAGVIELAAKDYVGSMHDLLRAKQSAPNAAQTQIQLLLKKAADENEYLHLATAGDVALRSHDNERAGDLFAAAWHLYPERSDAGFAAIACYLATPHSNLSLSILDVLAKSPDLRTSGRAVAIRAGLGEIDRRIYQRGQQSSANFKAVLAHYKDPENLTDLSGKKLSALIVSIQAIIASDNSFVPAHQLLAFCYSRQKNYVGAVSEYRQILALNPHERVRYWLARALYNSRQYAEAVSALEEEKQNPSPVSNAMRVGLLTDLKDAMKN
jgi:tetratricopeptide (TPR) repeat protein